MGASETAPLVATVGDLTAANLFGSGGGNGDDAETDAGGAGGGKVGLTISETATIDGVISASGLAGLAGGGGGAGGSIALTAKNILGSGILQVCGNIMY